MRYFSVLKLRKKKVLKSYCLEGIPMKKRFFSTYILIWLVVILAIGGIILFSFRAFDVENIEGAEELKTYDYHFVMIVEDTESPFWKAVYDSAKEEGEKNGALVEMLGENINEDYSVSELLEIAIYQKVDGILLAPSLEENIEELINEAVDQDIPVVTLMSDVHTSNRQTFVGISKYNLGEKYGEELVRVINDDISKEDETDEAVNVVFLEPKRDVYSQNEQIFSGIIRTVDIPNVNLKSIEVNNVSVFGSEEFIRNIMMETSEKVDVVVCVDMTQTESTLQAVIDFNKVGDIRIIGYFVSETILDAIEKGVIDASFVVDTNEIGEESIRSLIEKYENNRVTDYISINMEMINASNVQEYREKLIEINEEKSDENN